MRVLFLDIDGVLNRRGTKERCGHYVGVDRVLSDRLLKWLNTTDVKIVLSSTWRTVRVQTFMPDAWQHLNDAGIHWVDVTPDTHDYSGRGVEINAWLTANPQCQAFAILDDIPVFLPDQMPRCVITDPDVGVTDDNIAQLAKLFT